MDIKPLSHTTPHFYRLCLDFLWAGLRGTVGKEGISSSEDDGGDLVHPPSTSPLLPGIDDEGFSSVAQTSANQMIVYYGRKKFKVSTL